MYPTIRTMHLLLASFSLPFLLMYAVSAVQMTHSGWFDMKPAVHEDRVSLTPGIADARVVARAVIDRRPHMGGELTTVQRTAAGWNLRVVLPGTVHDVQYDRNSGEARVKTSVAGVMGMLNRLHHAAGLWHEPVSLQVWGVLVTVVSGALMLVGVTGISMWFMRRTERRMGAVLLSVNILFVVAVLAVMRAAGP